MNPLLSVVGLQVWVGSRPILSNLSLEINAAELVCIHGANGTGKSTLLACISGVRAPMAGSILFNGVELRGRSPDWIARQGILRTFQSPRIAPSLLMIEQLTAFASDALPRDKGARQRAVDFGIASIQSVGLGSYLYSPTDVLSFGQRRLLNFISTVSARPVLLLLDEPFAGLSRHSSSAVVDLLRRKGCAVLMVEHNEEVASEVADRVLRLVGGRLVLSE